MKTSITRASQEQSVKQDGLQAEAVRSEEDQIRERLHALVDRTIGIDNDAGTQALIALIEIVAGESDRLKRDSLACLVSDHAFTRTLTFSNAVSDFRKKALAGGKD